MVHFRELGAPIAKSLRPQQFDTARKCERGIRGWKLSLRDLPQRRREVYRRSDMKLLLQRARCIDCLLNSRGIVKTSDSAYCSIVPDVNIVCNRFDSFRHLSGQHGRVHKRVHGRPTGSCAVRRRSVLRTSRRRIRRLHGPGHSVRFEALVRSGRLGARGRLGASCRRPKEQ